MGFFSIKSVCYILLINVSFFDVRCPLLTSVMGERLLYDGPLRFSRLSNGWLELGFYEKSPMRLLK